MKLRVSPRLTGLIVLLLGIGTGACSLPERSARYQTAYPIVVQPDVRSLTLMSRIETDPMIPEERRAFDGFVRDYHMRSAGPVTIEIPSNSASGSERESRFAAMKAMLTSGGVDLRDILEMPDVGGSGETVTVSFATNSVSVPECGFWRTETTDNWANRRSVNHGCATQRNLGLMVANPGDLKSSQPFDTIGGDRAVAPLQSKGNPAAAATPAAPAVAKTK